MGEENPYAVGSMLAESPIADTGLATSANLEFVGLRVRCRTGAVLPAICVITGRTDNLVMLNRRLTTQWQIPIWGPTLFATLAFADFSTSPSIVIPSPLLVLLGIVCMVWALIQRFIVPRFVRACEVRYFICRDQLRKRRWIGVSALAGVIVFWNISPFIYVTSGKFESLLITGLLYATSLSIADRAFTGPVRLVLHGRHSRDLLEGFGVPFMAATQNAEYQAELDRQPAQDVSCNDS